MVNVGDICELVPNYTGKYSLIRIIRIITDSHYEFETEHGIERCHMHSLMADSFKVIASNVSSLAEFKSTNPEYFV